MVSWTQLVVLMVVIYISYTTYTFYELFKVPICTEETGSRCIQPFLSRKPLMQLNVYTSVVQSRKEAHVWSSQPFHIHQTFSHEVRVKVPMQTRKNGSLHVRVLLTEVEQEGVSMKKWSVSSSSLLTSFILPKASQFKLMGDNNETKVDYTIPTSHWHSKLFVCIVEDIVALDTHKLPADVAQHVKLFSNKEYLPIMYIDELSLRSKHLVELNESSSDMGLEIALNGVSYGKMRFFLNMHHSLSSFTSLGFSHKDMDEVKGIFVDTNLTLLLLTFIVSAFHLLFDMLAFKNDISFWKKNTHMEGLSTTSTTWRCISSIVIFFFLLDQQTSLLILIPSGISLFIEIWKMTKVWKLKVWMEGWRVRMMVGGSPTEAELKTGAFDTQALKALSWALLPLLILGAVYSLLYNPHKSWYSWSIQSLSNAVYAFGFIFMLPQLFINYKLKSVAHLPWKAFSYKAFNTFIDDIFAFIITMPTTHRLACFRDDLIFIIYLYQRWLYPVDKKRVNEYGQSFEETAVTSGTSNEIQKKEN